MKNIFLILISVITIHSASAQKYTDTYIKDANKVALNWLNDINHKQYENAYNLLSKEVKVRYQQEVWTNLINNLILEFGNLKTRVVTQKYFQSEVERIEDGFYVFI